MTCCATRTKQPTSMPVTFCLTWSYAELHRKRGIAHMIIRRPNVISLSCAARAHVATAARHAGCRRLTNEPNCSRRDAATVLFGQGASAPGRKPGRDSCCELLGGHTHNDARLGAARAPNGARRGMRARPTGRRGWWRSRRLRRTYENHASRALQVRQAGGRAGTTTNNCGGRLGVRLCRFSRCDCQRENRSRAYVFAPGPPNVYRLSCSEAPRACGQSGTPLAAVHER